MKRFLFIVSFILSASILQSQKLYQTGMSYTPLMGFTGNMCQKTNFETLYNPAEKIYTIVFTRVCTDWSPLQHYMLNPYAPSIVFKKRYIEMMVRSTAAHDTGLSIQFQTSGGNPDGSIGKTIPPVYYKINKANVWEIKSFELGGDADTVFKEIDYYFPNGTYYFKYINYGDYAAPSSPMIKDVPDQYINLSNKSTDTINLSGIAIPYRPLYGLTIQAHSKDTNTKIDFYDFGKGASIDSAKGIAKLIIHRDLIGIGCDSIFITLTDTNRKTSKTIGFKAHFNTEDLIDNFASISVYPTSTANSFKIEFACPVDAEVTLISANGTIMSTKNLKSSTCSDIDISGFSKGIYFVRISMEGKISTRKIIKE